MRNAQFGRTGVQVSELCLGTMTCGNEADEAASGEIMDRAVEAGVNFFDTADVYCGGLTEQITGRWLNGRRDRIVLASKVHYPTGNGVNDKGSSRIDVHPAYIERYKNPEYMEISTRFVAYAEEKALSPAALSVAWVVEHPAVTSAIVGARNVDQIDVALSSQDIPMDATMWGEITALSPKMPIATDREQGPFRGLSVKK